MQKEETVPVLVSELRQEHNLVNLGAFMRYLHLRWFLGETLIVRVKHERK